MYWMLFFLPSLFALIICFACGNAIPALIIGGVGLILGLLSAPAIKESNGTSGGLGVALMITLPFIVNGILLLLGSLIYYIAK